MENKGFTLVELLAVIVILAIITLVATPVILVVVNDAKKSAAISSSHGYVRAIEKEYMLNIIKNNTLSYPTEVELNILESPIKDIKVQGNKPSKGNVVLNKNGTVKMGTFCINNFNVIYDGKLTKVIDQDCNLTEPEVKENSSLFMARNLVYTNNKCKTDGSTYAYLGGCYIRGKNTANYAWFSGFMYRIMGINADGSVKMITEENVTAIPFGAAKSADEYDNSYIKEWLNNMFLNSISGSNVIVDQTWCSEAITEVASSRTTCTNNLSNIKSKVGTISLDEYNLASGSSSYLKNNQTFRTLTPVNASNAWIVYSYGYAYSHDVTYAYGLRPVINIKADTIITSGNGTLSSSWSKTSAPYIVNVNKIGVTTNNKKVNDIVLKGEYVKLDNKTYRMVSKDSSGVKLILDGYYTDTTAYGADSTFTTTNGIGQLLDTTVYNWLFSNQTIKNKVVTSTWYQGINMVHGNSYKTTSLAEINPITNVKVGLIKVGEILSGQSQSITSKQFFWTLTRNSASRSWFVVSSGNTNSDNMSNVYGVRPVIIVKSDLTITAGNGTPSNPYEI